MLNDFTGADRIYIACSYTDLRRGIDGLAAIVQQQFELNPFTNTLGSAASCAAQAQAHPHPCKVGHLPRSGGAGRGVAGRLPDGADDRPAPRRDLRSAME